MINVSMTMEELTIRFKKEEERRKKRKRKDRGA
jgi:hypothetical protein